MFLNADVVVNPPVRPHAGTSVGNSDPGSGGRKSMRQQWGTAEVMAYRGRRPANFTFFERFSKPGRASLRTSNSRSHGADLHLKEIIMKHVFLARAAAAALLSATIVVPGVAGLTAATANAAPNRCAAIWDAMGDSLDMASEAYAQVNTANGDDWMDTYESASRNYKRFRCGSAENAT